MSHLGWLSPCGLRGSVVSMMRSVRSALWVAGVGGWLVGAWAGTPLMADAPPLQEAPTPALASEWGVPTIWMAVLPELKGRDTSSLRAIVCGGAAVPKALSESYRKEIGLPILQAWA